MSVLNFRKDQLPILYANVVVLGIFTYIFASRRDYEFLGYILVIILVIIFINASNKRANFSNALSWILSIWGWLHLAGSAVYLNGIKLYEIILIPIYRPYGIFRYDHLVHSIGMIAATIGLHYIFTGILKPEITKNWKAMTLLLIACGLGIGVGNEIIEFVISRIVVNNGVGDYINTSLDQLANLLGIFIAIIYIRTLNLGSKSESN